MAKILWSKLKVFVGLLMVALAVAGAFLPIMPTIPFLLAAVAMLGRDHWSVRPFTSLLDRWRTRLSTRAKR